MQAIFVNVVIFAILLFMLIAQFLYIIPDHIEKIRRNTIVFIEIFIVKANGLFFEICSFWIGDVIVTRHLIEHGVSALERSFVVGAGIIGAGCLQHANKHSGFFHIQAIGFF